MRLVAMVGCLALAMPALGETVWEIDPAHTGVQFSIRHLTISNVRGQFTKVAGTVRGDEKDPTHARIEASIDRHPQAREKMAVRTRGRHAVTRWEVLERYPSAGKDPVASLIACTLETGRTHQIRVHMAHIGHPLIGDNVYGPGFKTKAALLGPAAREALEKLDRQALHAHILGFEHPEKRHFLRFRSELPIELARLRDSLAKGCPAPVSGIG